MATPGSATGLPAADRLLRGGLAAAVAAAAANAPTWAVLALATGAAAMGWTSGSVGAAAGVSALLLAILLTLTDGLDRQFVKAAAGALSATALLRAPGGRLGATAAATAVLAGMTIWTGLRKSERRHRRQATLAVLGLLGCAAVSGALGALAGISARGSLERSSTATTAALSAVRSGDSAAAATSARSAARDLRRAHAALGSWWARPAWVLPIVGAHLRAGDEVAGHAGPAVEAAARSADSLRLDVLRPEQGRLDLQRLAAAEPELTELSSALHAAERGARRARSPWLVGPLQDRLARYDAELASITESSDRALLAVQAVPRMLGSERPTRWFVALGNPAETRELGGCVCEFAIVTADGGRIHLERSGSVAEIGTNVVGRNLQGLDLPRRYLVQRPEVFWQNLGGYPDLPTVAMAARTLWDQVMPGAPLDGVIYVDPHGLAALLRLTGPVAAPPPLDDLTADNAATLLLREQYLRVPNSDRDKRKDALREVAAGTFTALSSAPLPGPGPVGAALGPAVQGGHLVAASFDPAGQRLFDALGASGRLPAADGRDLASLRTSNRGEDKLDSYIHREVRYQALVDPGAHRVNATATIKLRNEATANLPDNVLGIRGLPPGTTLTELAWYSGLGLEGVEVDGQAVPVTSTFERGWWTHMVTITPPPGAVTTVVFRLAGRLAATKPYRLAVAPQAAPYDDTYAVEVTGRSGWVAARVPPIRPGRPADLVTALRRG